MIAALPEQQAKGISMNTLPMNKNSPYPWRVDKGWIREQLKLSKTANLKTEGFFTPLLLQVLGWNENTYNRRKKFTREESLQIIALLKWLGHID